MVKIIGLSRETVKDMERVERLVAIAKETFPTYMVHNIGSFIGVYREDKSDNFYVIGYRNEINIATPSKLEDSVKLATAYERAGLGEFTVKKEYRE